MSLLLKSGQLEPAQAAAGELLLYSPSYLACSELVFELDRSGVVPDDMTFEQKRRWLQRQCIRVLRDGGALIDSNSGILEPGYALIRTVFRARNFYSCQVKRAGAMLKRALSVADAVEIATGGKAARCEMPQEILLTFMRAVSSQTGSKSQSS